MGDAVRVCLAKRPKGIPAADHFAVEEIEAPEAGEGEVLVRTRYWSVDPAMKGWVNDVPNYLPPVGIGETMRSFAVGEVVASRVPDIREGDVVTGLFGWQSHVAVPAEKIDRVVDESDLPMSTALGILGLNGVTAYFGLLDAGGFKAGDTVVVSTAAGAVGSAVGQIARLKGGRAVGITGGPEKVARCLERFGFDAALDYKAVGLEAALTAACPDGVDLYFDNTSGAVSDAVMTRLAQGARIVICGTAAVADWDPLPIGPRIHRQMLVARARMTGFLAFDYAERYGEARAELASWLRSGDLVHDEHVLEGAEAARDAIGMLYRGENRGKLLVKV